MKNGESVVEEAQAVVVNEHVHPGLRQTKLEHGAPAGLATSGTARPRIPPARPSRASLSSDMADA
jgi:hypothetical protein